MKKLLQKSSGELLRLTLCLFTLGWLIGALLAPDRSEMLAGFLRIQTLPAQLTKDYFLPELGSLSGAMLNYFAVGVLCCLLTFLPGATVGGGTVAAYFLTLGFCSYGMNAVNVLPFFFGVWVYAKVRREPFGKHINMAMFSTGLSPLVSEVLFRYPSATEVHGPAPTGVALALGIGLVAGLTMTALCGQSQSFHKGYDLYNAGPAASLLCFLLYALLYKTAGVEAPAVGATLGEGYRAFCNAYALVAFGLCFAFGFMLNGCTLKNFGKLNGDSGYKTDFAVKYGAAPALMNLGFYGLVIVAYYNLIGAKFTGPTFGAVWCMVCFAAAGSTVANVLPIMLGYFLASRLGAFDLNAQVIVVGLCFASGLNPITGRYGVLAGVFAGAMHYALVTSVPAIHGGFSLYNGGFTAGIVCFLLVPVLEAYVKPKEERSRLRHL